MGGHGNKAGPISHLAPSENTLGASSNYHMYVEQGGPGSQNFFGFDHPSKIVACKDSVCTKYQPAPVPTPCT